MRDIVIQLDMKYVVIVHTGDFYGRQGKDHMVAALRQRNICVASTLEITNDLTTVTVALQDMQTRLDKVLKWPRVIWLKAIFLKIFWMSCHYIHFI